MYHHRRSSDSDSIYRRLMNACGRADLAEHLEMQNNAGQVAHEAKIDRAITDWTTRYDYETLYQKLLDAQVPASPVFRLPTSCRTNNSKPAAFLKRL
ncbi:MAG: CoA transferase [Pyrinomonadaceae bacterium]